MPPNKQLPTYQTRHTRLQLRHLQRHRSRVAARLCRNSSWSTSQYWCPWNPAEIDKELQLSSAPLKKPAIGTIGTSKKIILERDLTDLDKATMRGPAGGIFWSCNKGWLTRTRCSWWYASVCEVRSQKCWIPFYPWFENLKTDGMVSNYWAKMKDEINQIELMRSNVDRFPRSNVGY